MNDYTDDRGRDRSHRLPQETPKAPQLSDKQVEWIVHKMEEEAAVGILFRKLKKFFQPLLWIIGSVVLVVGSYFQFKGWFGPKGGP